MMGNFILFDLKPTQNVKHLSSWVNELYTYSKYVPRETFPLIDKNYVYNNHDILDTNENSYYQFKRNFNIVVIQQIHSIHNNF